MNTNQAQELVNPHHAPEDVTAQRVARVYAESLLDAAQKQNAAPEVLEELDSLVHDIFQKDPLFEQFLSSFAIGREHKAHVLQTVFSGRASDLVLHFLMVLNLHERLELLRPIVRAYRDLYDQRAQRVRVQVRSAVPLADDQRQRLVRELHEVFHFEPILDEALDPELIGGMTVRVGDWIYDASVRSQLESLRNQLIARSSYEIQSGRNRFSDHAGD
jgi:F-type H+-transporting ATPase subunit delta